MKLTLKEMNGLLNGKCLPSDLIVGETLAEYLVRKFTELEQKLAESQLEFRAADATIENLQMQLNAEREAKLALAAENAGLKSVDVWMNADEVGGSAADKEIENGATPDEATRAGVQAVIESIKTPATDDFLAEVRAQGVDMFAAHKRERQQALRSRSMRMSEEAAGMAADAENFADELRKGVQS
ncbi:hypothetical protein [Enterobacter cloacae]|uniref:hypothetical protein n=1 Tax=Enterobacter cloacae TaxID=550 RepID=UPI002A80BEFF|nr:hypothetical protein [Enterobacter cloacae]